MRPSSERSCRYWNLLHADLTACMLLPNRSTRTRYKRCWKKQIRKQKGDISDASDGDCESAQRFRIGRIARQEDYRRNGEVQEELVKAGIMLAAEGLQASSKGKRVRFSGKNRTVIDGPFTETKELIAGVLVVAGALDGGGGGMAEALPESA